MVLENQGGLNGHQLKWGRVEKKGGPFEGQWMIDIRGPAIGHSNPSGRSPYKQFFAVTEAAVLAKAHNFLRNLGCTGTLVREGKVQPKQKVLNSTTTYRGHTFAYGLSNLQLNQKP